MGKQTHTHPLSKREIAQMRDNPNIASVTASSVRFTEDFKKLVYAEKQKGVSVEETLKRHGIDPDVLGPSRVAGFSYTLNKRAKKEDGFEDGRKGNYRKPAKTGEESMEQRVRRLEHELAYTRQEVEFLKKLQMANMEVRR